MIIPLLLALASADIKCPVKISITGTVTGDSGITAIYFDPQNSPHEFQTKTLPFDTIISVGPWPRNGALWHGESGANRSIEMLVQSKQGTVSIVCDGAPELCDGGYKVIELDSDCHIRQTR
jgi:hypothetical protein